MRQITSKVVNLGGGRVRLPGLAALTVLAIAAAGCGTSNTPSTSSSTGTGASHAGGTFTILANSAFGVADPAQKPYRKSVCWRDNRGPGRRLMAL